MSLEPARAWERASGAADEPTGWGLAGSQAGEDDERRQELRARLFSFADLLYQEAEHADPLLGPLVRRGWRTLIGGHTGEGKTTMALHMIRAIVGGGEFLGWRGSGGRALVIDVEQDLSIAQRRIVETWYPGAYRHGPPASELIPSLLPELHDSFYWRLSEGLWLDESATDRQVLEEVIGEVRPDVVLVDPLYKTFAGDPNEARLASRVMRLFDAWRERFGFGLVIPMHPRKPPNSGGTFTKHDLYGAGSWIWGAEVILGLKRTPNQGALLHFWKDRAGDLGLDDAWKLYFTTEQGFQRSAEGATPLSAEARIMQTLSEISPRWATRRELGQMLGASDETITKATQRLKAAAERGDLPALKIDKGDRGTLLFRVMMDPGKLALDRMRELFEDEEDEDA